MRRAGALPGNKGYLHQLRQRADRAIASPAFRAPFERLIARYLRRFHQGTEWDVIGRDALEAQVSGGQPVILCFWHGRLAIAPFLFDPDWGRLITITSTAWPGRTMGGAVARFGFETVAMRDRKANRSQATTLLRAVRSGVSLGFAADGPLGPAHKVQAGLIDWTRLTGAPIWLCSYSVQRFRIVEQSWDRMMIPKRGGKGIIAYRPWATPVPKNLSPEDRDLLVAKLQSDLDQLTLETDAALGHRHMIS